MIAPSYFLGGSDALSVLGLCCVIFFVCGAVFLAVNAVVDFIMDYKESRGDSEKK